MVFISWEKKAVPYYVKTNIEFSAINRPPQKSGAKSLAVQRGQPPKRKRLSGIESDLTDLGDFLNFTQGIGVSLQGG